MVGKAGRQDWQHVYTAVTRGRCRVYIIAEEAHLRSAILKNNVRRKTRLKHFLQNELSANCASPAEFASPSKGSGDSGGPSTQPSASLHPPATADIVTNSVPRSQASAAEDETLASAAGGWRWPSSDEADAGRDPAQARGSKRTCIMTDAESPNKVLMVGVMFSCARALLKYRSLQCAGVCWVLCIACVLRCAVGCKASVLAPLSNVLSPAPCWSCWFLTRSGWHSRQLSSGVAPRSFFVFCTFFLHLSPSPPLSGP